MKPWAETIKFSAPLRDVHLITAGERERRMEEQLRESYQRGLRDGERRLGEQLVQQRSELLELQNGLFNSLRQTFPKVATECQDSLIDLAIEVAEKLVAGIPIDRQMVESAIQEAISHVDQSTNFLVLLNPSDLELLEKFGSPLMEQGKPGEGIELKSSPEVTPGGCIVQTRFGVVDARRETKLELLKKTLQG